MTFQSETHLPRPNPVQVRPAHQYRQTALKLTQGERMVKTTKIPSPGHPNHVYQFLPTQHLPKNQSPRRNNKVKAVKASFRSHRTLRGFGSNATSDTSLPNFTAIWLHLSFVGGGRLGDCLCGKVQGLKMFCVPTTFVQQRGVLPLCNILL